VTLPAAAAGDDDGAADVDAAMDRCGHPACTVRRVLHMTTEASCVAAPRCCPALAPSAPLSVTITPTIIIITTSGQSNSVKRKITDRCCPINGQVQVLAQPPNLRFARGVRDPHPHLTQCVIGLRKCTCQVSLFRQIV